MLRCHLFKIYVTINKSIYIPCRNHVSKFYTIPNMNYNNDNFQSKESQPVALNFLLWIFLLEEEKNESRILREKTKKIAPEKNSV